MTMEDFWNINRHELLEDLPSMTYDDLKYLRSLVGARGNCQDGVLRLLDGAVPWEIAWKAIVAETVHGLAIVADSNLKG
jgi:hypothetical protein